jgi:hypothetical protein
MASIIAGVARSDPEEAYVHLPPLVARWTEDLLGGHIPQETRATCSNCAMCQHDSIVKEPVEGFRPDVKCCSFFPHLPNYSVGAILSDLSSETDRGRASVQARIDAKVGVTPLGLDAPATYRALYANMSPGTFGVSRAMRCPHYIDEGGGLCGIWRYRNSVCSTYYCRVVRGDVGREFWRRLRQLLGEVEHCLERWCVQELELGTDTMRYLLERPNPTRITAADLDGLVDTKSHQRLWGTRWVNREREFYVAAARLVNSLSWTDVLAIAGVRLGLTAQFTREAYAALVSDAVPTYLVPGLFKVAERKGDHVALQGEDGHDQIVVLRAVLDALPVFDGRRTIGEAIVEMRRRGVRVSEWVVRRLVDFKVLRAAP